MATKKSLNDAAFSLMIDDLTPILHILGVSYNEIGEIYYPGRNHPGKMYHLIWRRQHVPLKCINTLIKIVGERTYRIAWERFQAAKQKEQEQTPGYKKPEDKKDVPKPDQKPEEPKKLIPKPIEKVEIEKPKRKHKKRQKKINNEKLIIKPEEKKPEPKKIEPVNLLEKKPDKKKTIFEKLGKPLSDFNLKK